MGGKKGAMKRLNPKQAKKKKAKLVNENTRIRLVRNGVARLSSGRYAWLLLDEVRWFLHLPEYVYQRYKRQ